MRIWVFSDLQLDLNEGLGPYDPEVMARVDAEVVVIAGDLCPPLMSSMRAAELLVSSGRQVVYVPGNRDYYGETVEEVLGKAYDWCLNRNVHVLSDDAKVIGGVRFVGSTLWGDASKSDAEARRRLRLSMNDFRRISTQDRPWRLEDMELAHARARHFISKTLAEPHKGPTVVVSHLAPHENSVAQRHVGDPVTAAFVSDQSAIMNGPDAPALWIHGGLHNCVDYKVGNTRVLSNSRGYESEEVGDFDPAMVIDVGAPANVPAMA